MSKYSNVSFSSGRDKLLLQSNLNKISGGGIIDNFKKAKELVNILKKSFTEQQFPGERHAVSFELELGKRIPHNYTGPGTRLDLRTSGEPNYIPKPGFEPVSKLDENSRIHDISYNKIRKAKEAGVIDNKTKNDMIHEADIKFVSQNKAIQNNKEPILTRVANTLIDTKRKIEQTGLPTKVFSGFGAGPLSMKELKKEMKKMEEEEEDPDPVKKLKMIAKKQLKKQEKQPIEGGLIQFLAPLIGAMASPLINKLINKLSGSGIKVRGLKSMPVEQRKAKLCEVLTKEGQQTGGFAFLAPILGSIVASLAGTALNKFLGSGYVKGGKQMKKLTLQEKRKRLTEMIDALQ
jgi:hypothetical protein